MIPLALICAAPRTGTNHLWYVSQGFEKLKAHSEVFGRDHAFSCSPADLAAVEAITGCRLPRRKDDPDAVSASAPSTTQHLYDEPFAALRGLWEAREPHHEVMSVKLFGYHLPWSDVGALITGGAAPVVVKRRISDSYASKLKAQALQTWMHRDTTLVRVEADIRDYAYWYSRNAAWYSWLAEAAPGAPVLTYEDDIAPSVHGLVEALREAIPWDLGEWQERAGLRRQDRNGRVEDKIANWPEFREALEAAGRLDEFFGYF